MNYEQAMQYIHSIMRFGSKLGLERMRELMRRLGEPQKQTKFVHVAGTNGKGSTVTMLAEILQSSGYRVGKYTSPYVFDFRERIAVDGEMITRDALCELTERISVVCSQMQQDGWDAVTEFEVVTAIAFCYYAECNCDVVVLEVGLGGRFDATNIIDPPLVSVITALSLDHTAILGDTIEKIAFEKAGIIKNGCKVVVYPLQPTGALEQIRAVCTRQDCSLTLPDVEALTVIRHDLTGNRFIYKGCEYEQSLMGEYQIYNAITVLETVNSLCQCGLKIPQQAVAEGIHRCHMLARFEKVSDHPLIIMDAGHNPQGIDALTDLLDQMPDRRKRIVFAVMKDKEYGYAIENLAKRAAVFYGVSLDMPRALSAAEIVDVAKQYCKESTAFESVEEAIVDALENIGEDCLLICGSFYVMEQASEVLKNRGIF